MEFDCKCVEVGASTMDELFRIYAFRKFLAFCCFLHCFCFVLRICFCFHALVGSLELDVSLTFFCPADHVSDWQPRSILLGMVEARLVVVKNIATDNTMLIPLGRFGLCSL